MPERVRMIIIIVLNEGENVKEMLILMMNENVKRMLILISYENDNDNRYHSHKI
jgi:hypothetical protein